jgi:gluconate 5-dehydrogenase
MALVGFTRAVGADLGADGIRVNCIAPGYFLNDKNPQRLDDQMWKTQVRNRTPAARWGEATEIGGPAVFFMSPASSYVNSQTLFVDGGLSYFLQDWKT